MTVFRQLSRRRVWILIYILLLLLSHGWRTWSGHRSEPASYMRKIKFAGTGTTMAYREYVSPQAKHFLPLIMIHSSLEASTVFRELSSTLGDSYRILAPDFPGFGDSSKDVSDLSGKAHAANLVQFLDELHIYRAHILAYGRGGAVALHLVDLAPDRVASLIQLSAIGVQEFELLGEYYLNHGLYALLLGTIWVWQEALPHFGMLDGFALNTYFARSLFESDLRPLREILLRYDGPLLILHGANDVFLPPAAAREHARLVPQSELLIVLNGHLKPRTVPTEVILRIRDFTQTVESRAFPSRSIAAPERLAASQKPADPADVHKPEGKMLYIILFLLFMATIVSEDLTCITAGLMAGNGNLSFWTAAAACMVGIIFWDLVLFLIGKKVGRPLLRHRPFRWIIAPKDLDRAQQWFEAQGVKVIIASRFMPGTRLTTFLAAGISGMNTWKLTFYFTIASALWTPMIVGLIALLGKGMQRYLEYYNQYAFFILVIFILVLVAIKKLVLPLFNFRGRRLLLSSWKRTVRWEFWPRWAFYPPVVLYLLWLGVKYRCLTLITVCNPALPLGGVTGESKGSMLEKLDSPFCVKTLRVGDPAAAFPEMLQWMDDNALNFPVVLKPDHGRRGEGVFIARDPAQLQEATSSLYGDWLLQAYVKGREFGVFYYRFPGETRGKVLGITDKVLTSVTGDGRHTLEYLILKDDRAVCQAPVFLKSCNRNLFDIPAAGEEVFLTELATHGMGTIYKDGSQWITPELENRFDEISRAFEGFYFGLYDVRTTDTELFKRGEDFNIFELSGVLSEATHRYHPINSLWDAYRISFRKWRLAYSIGAANRSSGHRPVGIFNLLKILLESCR